MTLKVGISATAGFALAALGLLVTSWFSYDNINQISRNDGWVVHTHQVLDELRGILSDLTDAETGQRGYILTGEQDYQQPYLNAVESIARHLEHVASLTVDNPTQQERVPALRRRVQTRLDLLAEGITSRDTGGLEGGRDFVLTGKGKREMDEVRAGIGEMIATEVELLKEREARSQQSFSNAVLTLGAGAILGLGLVGIGYAMTAREGATRARAEASLQTANAELESRVHERTAALLSTNESLERSNRELEQFASVASHDLQEPLRKIQAFGDRINTKCASELGEQGRDYLERMLVSATRMRSLIDALLSFSRVTTKAQPFVPVDLALTARDVVSDLEDRVQRTGGRVELGELPTLKADPLQMRQLLQNLIANGLKFRDPDRAPLVQVAARLLPANGNGEVPRYELSVRDNGIGFEEVYLDRIFELFQRLHGRHEYEGTGMGLAICRKIAERHGGMITAKSKPGDGATFLVTLPVEQA